jgi:hypothetical protein
MARASLDEKCGMVHTTVQHIRVRTDKPWPTRGGRPTFAWPAGLILHKLFDTDKRRRR